MESMRQEPDVRDAALPRPRDQFTEIAGVPRWTQEAATVEVGRRSVLPGAVEMHVTHWLRSRIATLHTLHRAWSSRPPCQIRAWHACRLRIAASAPGSAPRGFKPWRSA